MVIKMSIFGFIILIVFVEIWAVQTEMIGLEIDMSNSFDSVTHALCVEGTKLILEVLALFKYFQFFVLNFLIVEVC